jgi:hypothetical protein
MSSESESSRQEWIQRVRLVLLAAHPDAVMSQLDLCRYCEAVMPNPENTEGMCRRMNAYISVVLHGCLSWHPLALFSPSCDC